MFRSHQFNCGMNRAECLHWQMGIMSAVHGRNDPIGLCTLLTPLMMIRGDAKRGYFG
jgi:hypothetical protein